MALWQMTPKTKTRLRHPGTPFIFEPRPVAALPGPPVPGPQAPGPPGPPGPGPGLADSEPRLGRRGDAGGGSDGRAAKGHTAAQ